MTLFDHHDAQRFLAEHAIAGEAGLISIEAAFIIELLGRIMTTQDTINADVATLSDALTTFTDTSHALGDEVIALKAQLAAADKPADVDTSALDDITAKLKAAAAAAAGAVDTTTVPAGDTTTPATPSTGDTNPAATVPPAVASTGDATAAPGADAGTTTTDGVTPDQTGDAGSATSTVDTADPTPAAGTTDDLVAASSIPAVPAADDNAPIDTTGLAALNAAQEASAASTDTATTDAQEG